MSVPPSLAPFLPGGRPAPRASGGHRPRQVHSPRVRRLAHDRGVHLGGLTGTGPRGRVTTDDVNRAASMAESLPLASPVAAPGTVRARHTAVTEVEVTRLTTSPDLLAWLVESSVRTVRSVRAATAEVVPTTVSVHGPPGGAPRTVVNAHDLGVQGIERVLGAADTPLNGSEGQASRPELSVHDLRGTGVLFDVPVLEDGVVVAISFGDVVDRPTVVELPDGGRGIGIGSFVHLALTVDEHLAGASAARLLARVRQRLEAHESGSSS